MEHTTVIEVSDRCRHCRDFKTKDLKVLKKHEEECRQSLNFDRKGRCAAGEGQDDCGESKKGVSDELWAPAVSEEDAPAVSEDVFDVDLSKRKEVEKTVDEESVKLSEDGGLFDNADCDLTDSEEEDNVEWGLENLRCSRLMWRCVNGRWRRVNTMWRSVRFSFHGA
ncbi:hypothetical protein Tco_0022718 [Tanacetum coccineum]